MKQISNYIFEKLHLNKKLKLEKPKRISTGKLYQWLRWYGEVNKEEFTKLFPHGIRIDGKDILSLYAGSGHIYASYYYNSHAEYEFTVTAEDFSDEDLYTLYTFLKENV